MYALSFVLTGNPTVVRRHLEGGVAVMHAKAQVNPVEGGANRVRRQTQVFGERRGIGCAEDDTGLQQPKGG